ncbi:MAG: hypothetical protein IJ234_11495 [Clostridia bacterium]|nr:hypothetical protein [Clostridia bacterium]
MEHTHPQGPNATHCHGDCSHCAQDPKEELIAVIQTMVNQNTTRANQLAMLAKRVRELGDTLSAEQVLNAVTDYEKGNMRLQAVLAALNMPNR